MIQEIIFLIFALLITMCSVAVVASRNPVTAAIFLVCDLFLLAGVYASLDADFAAAIQILVYAGAILVLFVFVIMLLNLGPTMEKVRLPAPELAVLLLTIIGFTIIGIALAVGQPTGASGSLTVDQIKSIGGNTYAIGVELFTRYLWPFELASILILLATVAAIVIAKKDKVEKTDGQALGKRRVSHGIR